MRSGNLALAWAGAAVFAALNGCAAEVVDSAQTATTDKRSKSGTCVFEVHWRNMSHIPTRLGSFAYATFVPDEYSRVRGAKTLTMSTGRHTVDVIEEKTLNWGNYAVQINFGTETSSSPWRFDTRDAPGTLGLAVCRLTDRVHIDIETFPGEGLGVAISSPFKREERPKEPGTLPQIPTVEI